MFTRSEIREGLTNQSRSDITAMLAMTWFHQIRGRERFPEIMDQREKLMKLWLTNFNLDHAAELVELIVHYGLKEEPLPDDYDPDSAEETYARMLRAPDERRYLNALRMLGLQDQRREGLDREIDLQR